MPEDSSHLGRGGSRGQGMLASLVASAFSSFNLSIQIKFPAHGMVLHLPRVDRLLVTGSDLTDATQAMPYTSLNPIGLIRISQEKSTTC